MSGTPCFYRCSRTYLSILGRVRRSSGLGGWLRARSTRRTGSTRTEGPDGDLGVFPVPARWSCGWLPRRSAPRHLATTRLGGCCEGNGRTEKRKAYRIFVCDLAISTSLVIWHLPAH